MRADTFCSDDVDEVREYFGRRYGAHSRQALGRGPLGYEWSRLRCGAVELNWIRHKLGQSVRGDAGACVVHVPLTGGLRYSVGRRVLEVSRGEARFAVPGQTYSVRSEPGSYLAVSFPLEEVRRETEARLGRVDAQWQPQACALLMSGPAATEFRERLATLVEAESAAGVDAETGPGFLRHAQARLLAWLGKNLAVSGGVRRASQMTLARMREVEEWIAAHLHEAITLGRLSEVAGVSGRALQNAFVRRHGAPPMDFVTDRRLEAVRARLQDPDCPSLVTRAAMECGFTHMGRFSILYRLRYGESPSTTRRATRSPS